MEAQRTNPANWDTARVTREIPSLSAKIGNRNQKPKWGRREGENVIAKKTNTRVFAFGIDSN
ncbi:hypothetical protein CO026_02360 [Candidatus Kaiserbacteria bacterium CG_4_9_14_0_2_um_filter_41_32]|uniref:Uncharacterized protein n=1 Tax=Candidatus Kaiserbacteria bacterium CG_4_9_14_0_2_um_filter_41_32 TaxID=1974601 RepID=A0A2M8FEJ7_9BACT|nr:MAG: hypothetical protein CO026_02360 [Candidatus Kaiserbacteria bacterium CG_4_9_14_0_2_um_filter_41_32]